MEADNLKGKYGEFRALLNLRLVFPASWVMLNDVVLDSQPDESTQLDHLLIGLPGVFLVETMAWEGAFLAHRDNWKRKASNR